MNRLLLFIIFLFISFTFLSGCTRNEKSKELLKKEGFSDIEMTGYRFFKCSEDDEYHTGFKAKKNGHDISGTVCDGLILKGETIRYD